MIQKLLYLTYVPINDVPVSGSSVRPQKMKEALESLNIDVKTFDGINNDLALRKKTVSDIKKLLKTWRPDACYIEPPSGPLFYYGDVELIKHLHKKHIPMAIFYRDAYWKYPEYAAEKNLSAVKKIKRFIIKNMSEHQWHIFRKNIDLIYFPSVTMAKEFDCPCKDTLPPGGFIPSAQEKKKTSVPLQFIFVGGAAKDHGTFLTLEAFQRLNSSGTVANLFYICPKAQWDGLGIDKSQYKEWLEVIHTSGDEGLRPYYEKSDVALLTAPRSFYRDFAVPIKIFEYLSYLKPVLVTDCVETERIVNEYKMGWVVKDNTDNIVVQLKYICNHPEEVNSIKAGMQEVRNHNLWISRAQKVIKDLDCVRDQ